MYACSKARLAHTIYHHSPQGIYRTAQWIKSQIHTRLRGEAAVLSVAESCENVQSPMRDVTVRYKIAPRQRAMTESKRILRATMERYWVRESVACTCTCTCTLHVHVGP